MYNNEKVLKSVDEYLRQIKKKKKIQTGIFLFFLFILLISLFLLYSPFFNISSIEIFGASKLKDDYIIELSEINYGENMLKLNEKHIISKLCSEAYIEKADITREWPDLVKINIMEREPLCTVFFNGQYVLLDKEGRVLENVSKVLEECPEINGIDVGDSNWNFDELKNNILKCENQKALETALMILQLADSSLIYENGEEIKSISKIKYIDVSNMDNIMFLYDNRLDVYFGKASELKTETVLYRFVFLDEVEKSLKNTEAIIDMPEKSISDKKVRVIEK